MKKTLLFLIIAVYGTVIYAQTGISDVNFTPQSTLHVHKNSAGQLFQLSNVNTTGGNTPTTTSGFNISIDASKHITLNQYENANMYFRTNNTDRMTILSGGNVGIGTTSPSNKLGVIGNIGWGASSEVNTLNTDQGGSIELGGTNSIANPVANGVPYIDFHFGAGIAQDYNVRVINSSDNRLDFITVTNGNQLSIHSTGIALSGTNKYINFGTTFSASGYGFRDNGGTLEYKHSGGTWTPFAQPPSIPGNVEWWLRPTAASYIRPMYNPYIRVYDTLQTYGLYFDGAQNQDGGWFRTTGSYNPGAAISAFYDVSGNQTYTYLGCRSDYTVGGSTVNRMGVYSYTDDPGTVTAFFRTTGNAEYAANVNYSNVWIAGYNYVDNASDSYNPSSLYGQLNVTNSSLGGIQSAIKGYSNRGTTAGNPGFTVGGFFIADAQNQNSIGVIGTTYSNTTAFSNASIGAGGYGSAGGYFDFYNYAGNTVYGYAYVAQYNGTTQRKIIGAGSVSEIIPTPNHGRITLTCPESPEYWYIDYGTVDIKDGKAIIELDPILADIIVVNDENPIRVFCTPINMPYFNGVTVTKITANTVELLELNDGRHSGKLDYQLVAKPKTNFGEGRFPQAPGPLGLKEDPPAARAKNQPDPSKIFRWPSDPEVYGYTLPKHEPSSIKKK